MRAMPVPTPIYRITHVSNLCGILQQGGMWSDAQSKAKGLSSKSIAYDELKARRAKRHVATTKGNAVSQGGKLDAYVPFYFANRSPMLYAIHGKTTAYQGGQAEIVYLVSSVQRVVASKRGWCFTDGHAFEGVTEFFDDEAELSKVDWDMIRDWSWRNTLEDLDRKRRKQAEFLVHDFFPWEWVERIGVINKSMKDQVAAIIASASHLPPISIEPNWYY